MRLVFFGLVVINLLVLAVHLLTHKEEVRAVVPALPAAAPDTRPLTLLSEMDQDTRVSLSRAAPAGVEPEREPVCTLVGPFVDSDRGAIVRERLRALGVESNLQSLEIQAGESYWVFLPPEASQQEALRRLHELQAKKIDSYVIPKGELTNGISFGVYTQPALAVKRQEEMVRLGYEAEIQALPRTQKELWLVLGPGQARRVGEPVWQELVPPGTGQEIRQNLCSAVASGNKFH